MTIDGLTLPAALVEEGHLPPDGSGRLAEARRLLVDGVVSVLTLDMFDTIVFRQVPRPTDVFVLLAHELTAAGLLDPRIRPAAFRRIRIEAESRARANRQHQGGGVEVALEEIWHHVPGHVRLDSPPELSAEHEVAVETRITKPDLDVVNLAELAVEQGCRLAVVSNTYLSAQQLARLLGRPEMEVFRQATLFPSSRFGVSKADGLWKIVLDELGVPAERIVHVGDEKASDVDAPSELGIHTVYVPKRDDGIEAVLSAEGALPPNELFGPDASMVPGPEGDYGLTGLRAKVASRSVEIPLAPDQVTAWRYGATVVGPILTNFAEWVLQRTEELGVQTAWCMMREGELLSDLVSRAGASRGRGVTAEPIWLSRHMTKKAIITSGSADELRSLLSRRLVPTVAEFLANLGLNIGEVPELRSAAGDRMDQPELAHRVVETLGDNEHLRTRIVEESTAARGRLLTYLRPVLSSDDPALVLVDLGWAGTIQRQLIDALRLAGIQKSIIGLYLATNEVAPGRIIDGMEIHGYLVDGGEPRKKIIDIGRSPEILEQSCLASCGSLSDFTESGQPILDNFSAPPEQVTSKLAVQQGIKAFQREWLRYAEGVIGWPRPDGGERDQLIEILRRSIVLPTTAEALTFGKWTHDDNFGVDRRDEVIPARLGAFAPYISPADLLEMSMQDAFWPMGLAAGYDPGLASAAQAVLDGAIPKQAFESVRSRAEIEASVDTGPGWSGHQTRNLRINHNGLSYGHWDLRADHIKAVRFDPCDQPCVFRIDWIELGLRVRGRSELVTVKLQGQEELSALIFSGCRWLYEGIGISQGHDPQVQIPLTTRVPGDIYGVEITVAFAVLPLPPSPAAVALSRDEFGTSMTWWVNKIKAETATGGSRGLIRSGLRVVKRALRS